MLKVSFKIVGVLNIALTKILGMKMYVLINSHELWIINAN